MTRSATAARARRHRARQRDGRVCRRIEVEEHGLAGVLIDSGRLTEDEALRPEMQERALNDIVADIIARWKKARHA